MDRRFKLRSAWSSPTMAPRHNTDRRSSRSASPDRRNYSSEDHPASYRGRGRSRERIIFGGGSRQSSSPSNVSQDLEDIVSQSRISRTQQSRPDLATQNEALLTLVDAVIKSRVPLGPVSTQPEYVFHLAFARCGCHRSFAESQRAARRETARSPARGW